MSDHLDFIVSAGHDEYDGGARPPLVEVVWNPHDDDIAEALDGVYGFEAEDKARAMAAERLGVDEADIAGPDLSWEILLRVRGTRDDVEAWFRRLVDEISGGPQGGDDDTFDYWPSGVRLAEDVAARPPARGIVARSSSDIDRM